MSSSNDAIDAALVGMVQSGDVQAFTTILERHKQAVFAVAFAMLGEPHDAEDVAQETFVAAYFHLDTLHNGNSLRPWLCSIARNKSRNWVSRWRRKQEMPLDEATVSEVSDGSTENMADLLTASEARQDVQSAIASLSPAQRETVILYYVSGYSQAEVARILEVPLGSVKRRLCMARRKLREELWHMVADELTKKQPAEDFTAKVQMALAEARKARDQKLPGEAAEHCDTALEIAKKMGDNSVTKELRAEALTLKAQVLYLHSTNQTELLSYLEEALALREQVGDKKALARHLQYLSSRYAPRQREKGYALLERAYALFQEIGDAFGQGNCLLWLGRMDMHSDLPKARVRFTEALHLLDNADRRDMYVVCQAALRLINKTLSTGRQLSQLLANSAVCEVLQVTETGLLYAGQPGFGGSSNNNKEEYGLPVSFLAEVAQLGSVWDDRWQPGYTWDGQAFSYTLQPLQFEARVSAASAVETPAGCYENAIRIDWSTRPSDIDSGEERQKQLNQKREDRLVCARGRSCAFSGAAYRRHQHRCTTGGVSPGRTQLPLLPVGNRQPMVISDG